jgi:preprotein translocase subunit SecG
LRRYNFMRPILVIAVAYLVNSIIFNVCIAMGKTHEAASNIGFAAAIIAVIITFIILIQKKRGK